MQRIVDAIKSDSTWLIEIAGHQVLSDGIKRIRLPFFTPHYDLKVTRMENGKYTEKRFWRGYIVAWISNRPVKQRVYYDCYKTAKASATREYHMSKLR